MVERWVSYIKLPFLEQARARISKTLIDGVELDMSTEECKKMLRRHVNTQSNTVPSSGTLITNTGCDPS